jgi:hypothetical protein
MKGTKAHIRYYTSDKQLVPGATTVLGLLAKPALIPWANKLGLEGIDVKKYVDKTAEVGTAAHMMVQNYLACTAFNDLSQFSPDTISQAENSLLSFYEWEKSHKLKPIMLERILVSDKHNFGGTLDCYAEVDGEPWLLDFKTGKGVYDEHAIQLAAYRQLLREHDYPVAGCRILRIGRDNSEGFDDKIFGAYFLDKQWQIFQHLLGIYWLRKEVG